MRRLPVLISKFSMLNTSAFIRIARLHAFAWFRSRAAGECDNGRIGA
jgi:hypothetical protein